VLLKTKMKDETDYLFQNFISLTGRSTGNFRRNVVSTIWNSSSSSNNSSNNDRLSAIQACSFFAGVVLAGRPLLLLPVGMY
jgi:hypothetical protein